MQAISGQNMSEMKKTFEVIIVASIKAPVLIGYMY